MSIPDLKQWQSLSPMTIGRAGAGAICANDHQFLVIGGRTFSDETLASCEFYDFLDAEWHNLPINLPTQLRYHGVAKIHERLFVMGGTKTNCNDPIRSLFCIDLPHNLKMPEDTKWKSLAPMNEGRIGFACASDTRYIYVFGGSAGQEELLDTGERYDIETDRWEALPRIPGGARRLCATTMIGNKIYLIGGLDKDKNPLASTVVFDTSKQEWEAASTLPNMELARFGAFAVVVNRFIIVVGGWHYDDSLSMAEVFDTQENLRKNVTMDVQEEKALSLACFFEKRNTIIVAGGVVGDEVVNTVEMQFVHESGLLPKDDETISNDMKQEISTGLERYSTGDTGDEELGLDKEGESSAKNEHVVREYYATIRGEGGRVKHVKVELSDMLSDVRRLITEQWTMDGLQKLIGSEPVGNNASQFDFYRTNGVRIISRQEKYTRAFSSYAHEWVIRRRRRLRWNSKQDVLLRQCSCAESIRATREEMKILSICWVIAITTMLIIILTLT